MKINEPWRESIQSTMLTPGPQYHGEDILPGIAAQLGIESVRASMLDRFSLVVLNNWGLNSSKDAPESTTEAGLDSAFIASRDVDYSLRDAQTGHTIVRKLSPRMWSFTWLANTDQLILVEVRYREPRDALDDKEAPLVRLLFLNLAQKDALVSGQFEADLHEDTAADPEEKRGSGLLSLGLLLLLCTCSLLAGWLALFGLPAANEELMAQQTLHSRLQTMADKTVRQHLGKSLATGDYGDLQDELSGFHALGYYPRAMVLNANKRVVAAIGDGNEAGIGDAVPESLANSSRSVPLIRGNEELGRVIFPERAAKAEPASLSTLRNVAAMSALAAILAAGIFLLFRRRR